MAGTDSASTKWAAAAWCIAALVACQGADDSSGTPGAAAAFDSHLAALGAATLDCLGTVDFDTYRVEEGRLERNFEACTAADKLREIDNLLGAQRVEATGAAAFMSRAWTRAVERSMNLQHGGCPRWERIREINAPTAENVHRAVNGGAAEKFTEYAVSAEGCDTHDCAVERAQLCAAGFGSAFVTEVDPARGRVTVDPVWWLDDTEFPPETNPFTEPTNPGYYHTMCYYGAPPGDIYGAVAREGEYCCKHYAGYNYKLRLRPVYCAPDWICMTECR